MKTEGECRIRIQELLSKELDRRTERGKKRLPVLCVHNHIHPLDTRPTIEGEVNEGYNRIISDDGEPVEQTIGLCMLNPDLSMEICEDPIDAQRCPYFQSKFSKTDLWNYFLADVEDPEWVARNLPDVAALCWVLGISDTSTISKIPWWKRVWFILKRVHVDPPVPALDLERLLPPPKD